MKKIVIFCVVIISLISCMSLIHAEESKEMVYASPSVQEEIYQLVLSYDDKLAKYCNFQIVKESITTMYCVDILEYARTGVLNIKPWDGGEEHRGYVAKVVSNEDGRYCAMAYILLWNSDGKVELTINYRFTYEYELILFGSESVNDYQYISCSYADHAERIRKMLGKDEIIPASDVRYVYDWYGVLDHCFIVNDNGKQIIIPAGYTYTDSYPAYAGKVKMDAIMEESSFKEKANIVLENHEYDLKRKEEWEKEHPGEEYPAMFGGGISAGSGSAYTCSQVENIINIYEYLGIDYSDNDTTEPTETPVATETELGTLPAETLPTAASTAPSPSPVQTEEADDNSLIIWIAASAVVVVVVAVVLTALKKRKR